jgi:hypothetical protein
MKSAFRWVRPASLSIKASMVAVWTMTGFGFLDYAAYRWLPIVGFAAIGVSCLLMGWLVESDKS